MLYEARNQPEHPYKNLDIAYGAPNNTDNWTSNSSYYTQPTLQNSGQANSQDNPYIIDSAAKLAYLSYNPSWADEQYFLQTADIDLVEHYWVPINNEDSERAYYYDGGNHTISNLYINTAEQTLTSSSYIGLFGCVYGSPSKYAYIKNVNIRSGSVSGYQYVGAIVGYAECTDITNCSNQGVSVSGSGFRVGGVVGYHSAGNITSSYNEGVVTGDDEYVGGVVGQNWSGNITSSYNTGAVEGSSNVGGVVGRNNSGNITSSYNTGVITGDYGYVGGVVGYNGEESITSSYNTGSVTGNSNFVGGVVGYNSNEQISLCYNKGNIKSAKGYVGGISGYRGTIITCYNTGSVEGSSYVGGIVGDRGTVYNCYYNSSKVSSSNSYGTPLTLEQMTVTQNGVAPVDMKYFYSSEWTFTEGETPTPHPYDYGTTEMPTLQDSGQANSQDNPYIIDSEAKLAYLSENSDWAAGKYFLQTENLDFSSYAYFVPINIDGREYTYYYDGGNKTISNLTIQTGRFYSGFFGRVYGSSSNQAYIKNVNITSGSVVGYQYVGAIVGDAYGIDIANCSNQGVSVSGGSSVGGVVGYNSGSITSSYNEGAVTGNDESVGGVVGYNNEGTITRSYNTGAVTGNGKYVGGVVGYNNYGRITSSYNTGSVEGSSNVGGVVGYVESSSSNKALIFSCFNTGDVTGGSYTGGVVGYNYWYGRITSSYNTGSVSGNGSVGGVAGYNDIGTITSSYNTGDVTGSGNYVGGVVGYNDSGNITSSYNTGSVSGNGYVGGVVGFVISSNEALISSCFSTGSVEGSSSVGGVVGYIFNSGYYLAKNVSISWCYYNTETVGSFVTKAIGKGNGYQCYGLTTAQMQGLQSENYMYLSNSYWNFAPNAYPTLKYVVTTLDIVVETPPTNSGDNPVSP